MFFLICNRIDCYITINTFEHVVFDLSDTPYSSTFPHKFTFYRVFARKKLNWEFPVCDARSISISIFSATVTYSKYSAYARYFTSTLQYAVRRKQETTTEKL